VIEAYSNPLQTIIEEIKNISPETINVLIFKNSGQTIANTRTITENQTKEFITNFASIAVQAETIGGIDNYTIQAPDKQLNVFAVDNCFLASVSLRTAKQEILKSLTQVVVPTVVRLVNQVEDQTETQLPKTKKIEFKPNEENVLTTEEELEQTVKPIPDTQPNFETFLPRTPTNQFMIEKIGGLLVSTDTVRIDDEIIEKWSALYEGKQFDMVIIEALDGKKTTCKFKKIKESKNNAKGIIQIPEKILQTLQTEKGKLVIVKPVIE
jgi:hypothetical protein